MRAPPDRDPPRWRDLPPPARGARDGVHDGVHDGVGDGAPQGTTTTDADLTELGAVSRTVASFPGPDELRLAQIRQRVLQQVAEHDPARPFDPRVRARGSVGARWNVWAWQGWARVTVTVVASLLVGGVATAVTGRLIEGYRKTKAEPPAVSGPQPDARAKRAHRRHWRVSVKTPTDLDLLVGPDGTEVEVVGGQASMSGEGITGSVDVVPGRSWREREIDGPPTPPAPRPPQATSPASPPPAAAASVSLPLPRPVPAPARPAPVRLALVDRAARSAGAPVPLPAPPVADNGTGAPTGPVNRIAPPPSPFEPPPERAPPLPAPSLSPPPSAAASPPPVPRVSTARPPRSTGAEAALVGRALGRLRRDHDPTLALADLDAYARDFPRGELRHEATMARAEALLALQRNGEALAILDAVRLGGAATERRVALARAELRAQDGRRSEAIGDFDRVIAGGGDDELTERALFGRSLCRLRGGDLSGARADLHAHSEQFPTSARHDEVERLLRRLEN